MSRMRLLSRLVRFQSGLGGHRTKSWCRCRLLGTSSTGGVSARMASKRQETHVPVVSAVEGLGDIMVTFAVATH